MHNGIMARKKSNESATDRHKPSRLVRVREKLAVQHELLAERRATDVTEEVNRAVRELLEREELWPPATKPDA